MGNEFELEVSHLNFTVNFLKAYHASLNQQQNKTSTDILDTRKMLNDDVSNTFDFEDGNVMDFISMLPEMRMTETNYNYIEKMLDVTSRMIKKPYFGRLTADDEPIYIGNATIQDNNQDILIYDWRSPVASLFYENRVGELSYTIPDGSKIKTDVSLRRQFQIENSELLNMFDSDLYIGDEMLQQLITDSSGAKLKNIVATIQSEQNIIIRQPLNQNTLVYGPPGSGKTSLAMQRIAYLMFTYRKQLKADNILLMSPNEVFNDYVSDVLPELGEDNVKNMTFYRMLKEVPYFNGRRFESLAENIQRLNGEGGAAYRYKTSRAYFDHLKQYMETLGEGGMYFRDLKYGTKVFIAKEMIEKVFYNNLSQHPVSRRLHKIYEYLLDVYQRELKWLTGRKFKELDEKREYIGEKEELQKMANDYATKTLARVHQQIRRFRFVQLEKLYVRSITDKAIRSETIENVKRNHFMYEDVAPMMYLYIHLLDVSDKKMRHVIVDEVQDYSNIQYAVMTDYYSKSTFTSLGDKNQQIHPVGSEELDVQNHHMMKLQKSYRSTNQINDYLNTIVPGGIESVSVDGRDVQFTGAEDEGAHIREMIAENLPEQMAIITPSREAADEMYEQLKDDIPGLKNLQEVDTIYNQDYLVLPYYLSKGFEYNTVVITESAFYDDLPLIKYVLASRATRNLYLLN